MAITATVTVKFERTGDKSGGFIATEVLKKLSDGTYTSASQFKPGDSAYIACYLGPDTELARDPIVTAGNISAAGTYEGSFIDGLNFTTLESDGEDADKGNTASLSKPANSFPIIEFFGNNPGELTLGDDNRTLTAAQFGIYTGVAKYKSTARLFKLDSPASLNGKTSFDILIVIVGRLRE